jgi:serine/threonine protein kinase
MEEYDWGNDDAIWSSKEDGVAAVQANRWKLMLVDFGFARALELREIETQTRHLRNSILYESSLPTARNSLGRHSMLKSTKTTGEPIAEMDDGLSVGSDDEVLSALVEKAALSMRHTAFEATNETENAIMGGGRPRKRLSHISMPLPTKGTIAKRTSTARFNVRSMSALGTKAYAAPEIRRQLRQKTDEDFGKENAAMTECVADYGMIVDAYSVGWTLRVAITGVPPNFTISEYMMERDTVVLGGNDEYLPDTSSCCCFTGDQHHAVRVRDPSMIPHEATLLITSMAEKKPEDRMTVREAQNHPYIAGEPGEGAYDPIQGDYPARHGDPLVPLACASELSSLTIRYHMS